MKASIEQKTETVIVVGNGMVGHHFVQQLCDKRTAENPVHYKIIVIAAEPRPAYDRVHLSSIFSGSTADDLALTTADEYAGQAVQLYLQEKVVALNQALKSVTTDKAKTFVYDHLILATGSYPFVPPIPGNEHKNCLVYRTIEDLEAIKNAAKSATRGVVVGGGLLGLECANAIRHLGLETHVVEFASGLMVVQLDAEGSVTLQHHIEDLGVAVHTNKATQTIEHLPGEDGQQDSLRLNFSDDTSLETDLIVFSAGIRPQDELAINTPLTLGDRGGIVINTQCQTNIPNVYAIGECASFEGRIFGLVAPGYRMAEVAAAQISGEQTLFLGADMSTKLKLLGVDVGAIGDAQGQTPDCLSYIYKDPSKQSYSRLNVSKEGKKLLGAVLVGDCEQYDTLLQYYLNDIELPSQPESLLFKLNQDSSDLAAIKLPDTATICSCHNVFKSQILGLVDQGVCDLSELKLSSKASTGCGGCTVLLKSVFEDALTAKGISVDTSLCEHFNHTRQALFHICTVEDIKDFKTLITQHGQGKGCDICKPTAASIFASLYNEHILEEAHVGLQDTNDHSLANMQKNGSYSIVPRIPGGEITPDKLIKIGEVAKQFDLYTKITGGQRIDLFGAQLHELPKIWRLLIDAGFETGHAYGKSLRTVKSCVGNTWCRFGVQDSVAMALYVENRYKGLRSPHKIKMAVSGCTRECAEAQSKDVGIIATENGWNMYVGGNGGMRPRHADLFATDLDDQTLIQYIDRFLGFYIQTADRLQRTSVWLDNLEGGLSYVQDVVINDSLDINHALESRIAEVVGSYQCEWKTAIETPEKLKRFRQFANSEAADSQMLFVRERGQRRPARPDEISLQYKEVN